MQLLKKNTCLLLGMTLAVHLPRSNSASSLKRRRSVSSEKTTLVSFDYGRQSHLKRAHASTTSAPSTIHSIHLPPSTMSKHTGKTSGRKCVAGYSRNRRRPGQKAGEDFLRNRRSDLDSPATTITKLYLTKLRTLDMEAQAELTFKMWDILAGTQTRQDDVIKTQIICAPETVPTYIKRDVAIREIAIDTSQCHYCYEKNVDVVDDTDMLTCLDCGAIQNQSYHFETPFKKGGAREKENPHFRIVHKHVYDRMSHFKALLHNVQGLGQGKLCEKMQQTLLTTALALPDPRVVDHVWVTEHLKRHKQGKYIPQAVRLARLANPFLTPPYISEQNLEQLELGFVEVCRCFDEWIQANKTVKRKNFMSYPYIAHQLLTRVGLPHLCAYLNMIRGDTRLDAQNKLWENVCEKAKWAYKPL